MPRDEVRIVIMGMSPYHKGFPDRKPYACGYAFAIEGEHPYKDWPASLKYIADGVANMLEIETIESFFFPDFRMWRDQGVLLLNAALTCEPGSVAAHVSLWEPFTTSLIGWLNSEGDRVIFYFMGQEAQKYSKFVYPLWNPVLMGEHPARAARENRLFEHKFEDMAALYKEIHGDDFLFTLPF